MQKEKSIEYGINKKMTDFEEKNISFSFTKK